MQHLLSVVTSFSNRLVQIRFIFTVRGGLSLREAIMLMEIVHATGRLRAVDLVEINPAVGNEIDRKRTIEAGMCVLKAALGFSRRGTAPRDVLDLPIQDPKP